jgi:pSer/pThr/pTyr-binding forkhead associated (FHA) protein
MSPSKPPGRGPKQPSAPGDDAPANPWASYNEADDWNLTGDGPLVRADPTGRLDLAAPSRAPKGGRLAPTEALRIVEGGEVGRLFALDKSPITLGRGSDNDIVLADASISRAHAVLEHGPEGWTITDQQSGNGTLFGGKRITRAALAVGDTVALGQVHLRLERNAASPSAAKLGRSKPSKAGEAEVDLSLDVSQVLPPDKRPRAAASPAPVGTAGRLKAQGAAALSDLKAVGRQRRGIAVGVALAVCLGLWGRAYLRHADASAKSFARCAQGIAAFGAQRWDEAEQAFADALAISPHHALSEHYQDALLLARRDAAVLTDAQERRERGDFQRARAALASLDGTPFVRAAWLEAAQYGAAITQVALQAETALGAGLDAEARSLLDSLGQPAPPRQDLRALNAWAALRAEHGELEAAARALKLRAKAIPSLWEQAQTQSPAMRSAIAGFRSGSAVSGPALGLRRMHGPKSPAETALVAALKRFANLYETALVEHRGKRAFAAIKLFGEARAEAVKIAGEGSRPARDVDAKMADMYYVLGVQALMGGRLAEASEALTTAVHLRPGHGLSLRRLDELNERAERMVDEAEFMGISHASKAQELLRQVLGAMPPQASVSVRARKLLKTLGGRP